MPKRYLNGSLSQYRDPDILYYTTIANMRGFVPVLNNIALAILTGDPPVIGVGSIYAWDNASAVADNGTTVIKPTDVSGNGRWIRIII